MWETKYQSSGVAIIFLQSDWYRRCSNYASFLILCHNTTFQTGNFQWCVTLWKLIFYCCVTRISWVQNWMVIVVSHRWCIKLRHISDMAETSLVVQDGNRNRNSSPTFVFSVWGHSKEYGCLVGEKRTMVRVPGNEHDRFASNAVMQSKYSTE